MTDSSLNEEQDGAAKKGGGMIVTIVAVLVLSLLGAGGGWVVGGMLAPGLKEAQDKVDAASASADESHGKTDEEGKEEEKTRPNLLQLPPITTNLSFPSDNWVRLEVALVFRDLPDEALADRINEDILSYLRTVSLQQIEGPRGFQYLHDDLADRARLRSEGKVTDVIFRTFVIE